MKKKDKRELLVLITIAVLVLATWYFWPGDDPQTPPAPADRQTETTTPPDASTPDKSSTVKPAEPPIKKPTPTVTVKTPVTVTQKIAVAQTSQLFNKGVEIFETQPVTARTLLSAALLSGKLSQKNTADARGRLQWLGENTLLNPSASFNPAKDPYTLLYTFKSGDVLEKIERNLKLHVPSQILMKINGIARATQFQAGRTYKLIKGPFHAVVSKSNFTMDLYLHRSDDNLPNLFIKRYRVGLGRDSSTPLGKWRLGCGAKGEKGKAYHPGWDPPPNSGKLYRIEYGQPEYPFGNKGLWIGLVGTDENTRNLTDYGIHSTDDQASIGKNASLGCIRMADDDIEEVYSLLYEYWSTVEIVP